MQPSPLESTFRIGEQTLPYVRRGINQDTAQKICEIIRATASVSAVAVTDDRTILGYAGDGCPFMVPGRPILTDATRTAIRTGCIQVVEEKAGFRCPVEGCPCPLQAAVIVPLQVRERVVGTVKLYRTDGPGIPEPVYRFAWGIGQLLSLQLEVAEADRLRELTARARLEALQAQIRPHFLFNALQTILLYIRTDAELARRLLLQLAAFLRRALTVRSELIPIEDELEYVRTYLELEQARFGPALRFRIGIDPRALGCLVPVLTVQPLVENAVVHGLAPREGGGSLVVRARVRRGRLEVVVFDTGVGIAPEVRPRVFEPGVGKGMGLGLSNVHERLVALYGPGSRLRLRSRPGRGTLVRLSVPPRRAAAGGDGDGHGSAADSGPDRG